MAVRAAIAPMTTEIGDSGMRLGAPSSRMGHPSQNMPANVTAAQENVNAHKLGMNDSCR
jgi:hypothetical protein